MRTLIAILAFLATTVSAAQRVDYVHSYVGSGNPVPLLTNVPSTVTSITLTPGDWDVYANSGYLFEPGTSFVELHSAISLVDNMLPPEQGGGALPPGARYEMSMAANVPPNLGSANNLSVGPVRLLLLEPTVVYLVARGTFTGTMSGYGVLRARRFR